MARPFSQGLEYFPVDVDIFDDPKIFEIDYLYPKGEGSMFFLKMCGNIYSHSYYKEWTEMTHRQFCQKSGLDPERSWEMLKDCLRIGLFNVDLYNRFGILTSSSMQERWLKIVRRRLHVILYKDHILLSKRKIADLKIKGIVFYDSNNQELPKEKSTRQPAVDKKPKSPSNSAPKAPEDPNIYGVAEIKRDIPADFKDASDDIKANFKEAQYKSYQFFNKILDESHPTLRNSVYQITLSEYVKLHKSLKFNTEEIKATLKLMAGTGLKGKEDMDARFEQYLGYVRNPNSSTKAKMNNNEPKKKTSNSTVLFDARNKQ